MFIGTLKNAVMLDGVGLANIFIHVFGFATFSGINGAFETFASQALGNGNKEITSVYLNRGRIINTILMIPISIIMYYSGSILVLLKQDKAVSQ